MIIFTKKIKLKFSENMAILSITFHIEENTLPKWNEYMKNELKSDVEILNKKTLLSEVETEMLSEGKNINLLIFFENEEERNHFTENTFFDWAEKIAIRFGEKVLIFKTLLNEIKNA